ncbi:hypothetical protein RIVM261_075470 [Rivularia sp. IAM M-261]|nr:hypothetical protein RIVM261_075470 [Rivularia sp. IAM M-261]
MLEDDFLIVTNEEIRKNYPELPLHALTMLVRGQNENDWYISCYHYPGQELGTSFDGVQRLIYNSDSYVSIPNLEKATGQRYDDLRKAAKRALIEDAIGL